MAPEPVGGDRVVVASTGAPIDERFRHMHQLGHLFDAEVTVGREEVQLLRLALLGAVFAAHFF